MNKSNKLSPKVTLIITAILLPIICLSAIGGALAGLEGINPENHGKTIVFTLGEDGANLIKTIFVYFIVPVSFVLVILAGLNFKYKNAYLNRSVLIVCLLLVGWLFFANWGLGHKFVSAADSSAQQQGGNSEASRNGSLRIRSIDLN